MMQSHPSTMTVAHVHDDTVTPVQDDAVAPFHDDTVAPVHDDAVAPVHDEHRIRKRRSNPQKWVENIKKSKGAGKAYIYSRGNEKRMEEPQPSDCRTCLYKCNIKFTEEDRGRICREYWQLEDYAHQKDFILSNVDRFDVQRQRSRGERKRTKTQIFVYSFKNGSEVVRVCKRFFLKTIDISHGPVHGFRIYCITWTYAMSYTAASSSQQEYSATRDVMPATTSQRMWLTIKLSQRRRRYSGVVPDIRHG